MASIQFGTELMTNYVAAVAVPASSHMVACLDDLSLQPFVFALSNATTPKLQVIKTNAGGQRELIDIGSLLRVPADKAIQAFDVQQAKDLKLYLSFATKEDDRNSKLWVVEPFLPSAVRTMTNLTPTDTGLIRKISMGLPDGEDQDYPTVWLYQQPLNRTALNDDIGRVEVLLSNKSSKIWKDMTTPVNAGKVVEIVPANGGRLGEGLIFLLEQNNERSLFAKFLAPGEEEGDRATPSNFKLVVPPGSQSVSTFVDFSDDWNRSTVVVGANDGLHLFTPEAVTHQTASTLIQNAPQFAGAKNLFVTQDGDELSIWSTNAQSQLVYLTTSASSFTGERGAVVMDQATAFAAVMCSSSRLSSATQALIVNDSNGNLALLEQSLDTGVWRHDPFYVETSTDMLEVPSYTINITALDANKSPLSQGSVFVQSASVLTATVNGMLVVLDHRGAWHSLDVSGEIAFIIPTSGLSTQPLTVTKLRNAAKQELTVHNTTIDASAKVVKGLATLSTREGIDNAATKDGKSLWAGTEKPSSDDLDNAAQCFSAISVAYGELPTDGRKGQAQSSKRAVETMMREVSVAEKTGDPFMDGWNWVKQKARQAKEWIIRKAGDVWQFVCKIGGAVKSFVLDCVEKVTEAASFVWEKLNLGWQKLCDFAGFVFSWGDILEMKDTIKGLLNAGCDFAKFKVDMLEGKIDTFFSGLQADVAKLTADAIGDEANVDSSKGSDDEQMQEYSQSPATKWIGERMKNSGGTAKGAPNKDVNPEAANLWNDHVEPLLKSFVSTLEGLGRNIAQLFDGDKKLTPQQLVANMTGQFVSDILEVVKQLLKLLVSLVGKLVEFVKWLGNANIEWSYLNTLYRFITRGSDLSIFDAVSLIVAIPATIIIKLVTGKKPPSLGTLTHESLSAVALTTYSEQSAIRARMSLKPPTDPEELKALNNAMAQGPMTLKRDMAVVVLGSVCGVAVLKVLFSNLKLIHTAVKKGIPTAIESNKVIEMISMALDGFGIISDLISPPDDDAPGADLRRAATCVKTFRLALNALHMLAGKLGMDNPLADKIKASIDLLTVLANCGLYTAVYVKEIAATGWKGQDKEMTAAAVSDTLLETAAGAGYFTAYMFHDNLPPVAAVGLAVMVVGSVGGVVTKGVEFKLKYARIETAEAEGKQLAEKEFQG